MKIPKLIIAVMAVFLSCCTTPSELAVSDLKCEYRNDPLGIDNTQPRLSWKLEEANFTRGQKQTAYQILVASSRTILDGHKGDVWDSGKVASDQSVNTLYQGNAITKHAIQVWQDGAWKDVAIGTDCGKNKIYEFDSVTATKCRIFHFGRHCATVCFRT